jgi:hypothetical protein
VAQATAEYQLRLSAFCFRFSFFRSFPFVIHAEAALASASTGICLLHFSMDHRIKCGGDE